MATNKDTKFVFRLQDESNGQHDLKNTLKDWDESRMFDDKQIKAIESSNEHSLHEPTSIPSPFARIALAKTAFGEVAEYGEKALAAYQKIVSDSLDVAEIFFTFKKWKNQLEVIKWDKTEDLEKLGNHKILHKTLTTFLQNDAEAYNFDRMKAIYILKHKATGKMLGATSPCTLFFSTANNVNVDIELSNGHKAFQSVFPLHKRSWDFQKYLYTWLKNNNETRQIDNRPVSIFDEFAKYLDAQKPLTSRVDEIDNHLATTFSDYDELRAPEVEILGKSLHKSKTKTITPSDMLENKIIRLPYKIQKDIFFDGNLNDTSNSYLLPVTSTFFTKYTVEDLQKWIKISENGTGGSVTVRLNIPDLQPEIRKEYQDNGAIVKLDFDFALFPNIKFRDKGNAYYRFGIISEFNETEKFKLSYYNNNNNQSELDAVVRNIRNRDNAKCCHYYLDKDNFDYLQIAYDNNAKGLIIPKLDRNDSGSKRVTFAVDLGTTNTHIEYTIDSIPAKALDISTIDTQINILSKSEDRIKKYDLIFDADLMPETIGTTEEYGFPMRTALSEASNTDWRSAVFAMVHANVPFDYERRSTYDYNTITPNLKWSNDTNNMKRVKTYIESLFLILRNKVILCDGDLKATKIVWFYPISMTKNRFNLFKTEWEHAYKKYFGENVENIIPMTESVAPYEFYKSSLSNANDMVTVDIGGGTTDIVIAQRGEIKHITSFRFAANSIFGDGYATNQHGSIQNGIVRQFKSQIYDVLSTNGMDDLLSVYNEMNKNNISAEIASFLFSLNSNKTLIDKNISDNVDLNKLLQADGSQKIIFVFFYTAIIYHLAHILKATKMPTPRHIAFSGNGSKVIRILSNDTRTLEKFTKKIFEKVYERTDLGELTIIHNAETPKQATCKGGISNQSPEDYDSIMDKKVILKGSDNHSFITTEIYGNINSEDLINKTTEEAKNFIQFVLDLNSDFSFKNNFGVDTASVDIAKSACEKDLETFTRNGLELKRKEVENADAVEETFFFYPLTGMLYELSNKICESQNKE